jgi:hypothetical protein
MKKLSLAAVAVIALSGVANTMNIECHVDKHVSVLNRPNGSATNGVDPGTRIEITDGHNDWVFIQVPMERKPDGTWTYITPNTPNDVAWEWRELGWLKRSNLKCTSPRNAHQGRD